MFNYSISLLKPDPKPVWQASIVEFYRFVCFVFFFVFRIGWNGFDANITFNVTDNNAVHHLSWWHTLPKIAVNWNLVEAKNWIRYNFKRFSSNYHSILRSLTFPFFPDIFLSQYIYRECLFTSYHQSSCIKWVEVCPGCCIWSHYFLCVCLCETEEKTLLHYLAVNSCMCINNGDKEVQFQYSY